MHSGAVDQTRFDLLNQAAQQRLRARVADAGGNIGAVADEIRAQLDELDQEIARDPESGGGRHADRAWLVAQQTFVVILGQREAQPEPPQRERGGVGRLRAA